MEYVIVGRKRWNSAFVPIKQVSGREEVAVDACSRIFSEQTLNMAAVLNSQFILVFDVKRKCSCKNAQYLLSGELMCEDCGLVLNQEVEV